MWTYQTLYAAHVCRIDDVSSDEYLQGTDKVIKHLKFVK